MRSTIAAGASPARNKSGPPPIGRYGTFNISGTRGFPYSDKGLSALRIRLSPNCRLTRLLLSCSHQSKFGETEIDIMIATNEQNEIAERLVSSKVYQDYERAFCDTTGLPVTLRPVESWQLPHSGRRNENKFCSLMAQKSRSCAACLQTQQRLAETAREHANTVSCSHRLSDTAMPVRLGARLIRYLQTGPVLRKNPTGSQFDRLV